jgi:hypothetical protein
VETIKQFKYPKIEKFKKNLKNKLKKIDLFFRISTGNSTRPLAPIRGSNRC